MNKPTQDHQSQHWGKIQDGKAKNMEGTPNRSKRLNLSEPQTRQSASRASTAPKSGYQTREGFNGEEPERAPRPNADRRIYQVTLATEPRGPHHQGKALREKIKKREKEKKRKERKETTGRGKKGQPNEGVERRREAQEEGRNQNRGDDPTFPSAHPCQPPHGAQPPPNRVPNRKGFSSGNKGERSEPCPGQGPSQPTTLLHQSTTADKWKAEKGKGQKKNQGEAHPPNTPPGAVGRENQGKRGKGKRGGQKAKKQRKEKRDKKKRKRKRKKDRKEIKKGTAQHKGRTIRGGRRPDRTGIRQRERQSQKTDGKRHEPIAE